MSSPRARPTTRLGSSQHLRGFEQRLREWMGKLPCDLHGAVPLVRDVAHGAEACEGSARAVLARIGVTNEQDDVCSVDGMIDVAPARRRLVMGGVLRFPVKARPREGVVAVHRRRARRSARTCGASRRGDRFRSPAASAPPRGWRLRADRPVTECEQNLGPRVFGMKGDRNVIPCVHRVFEACAPIGKRDEQLTELVEHRTVGPQHRQAPSRACPALRPRPSPVSSIASIRCSRSDMWALSGPFLARQEVEVERRSLWIVDVIQPSDGPEDRVFAVDCAQRSEGRHRDEAVSSSDPAGGRARLIRLPVSRAQVSRSTSPSSRSSSASVRHWVAVAARRRFSRMISRLCSSSIIEQPEGRYGKLSSSLLADRAVGFDR